LGNPENFGARTALIRPAVTALWSAENASLLITTSLNGLGLSIYLIEFGYHLINPEDGLRAGPCPAVDCRRMSTARAGEPAALGPQKAGLKPIYQMISHQQAKSATCAINRPFFMLA
jgi:hypothetical protein